MPNSSGASESPFLIKLKRSRLLAGWWVALHMLLGLAVVAVSPHWVVGAAALSLLAYHYRARRPASCSMLLVAADGRFALPDEGRFRLRLAGTTCLAGFWAELAFEGLPGRVLLLRDQFTDSDWRRLVVVLRESG